MQRAEQRKMEEKRKNYFDE